MIGIHIYDEFEDDILYLFRGRSLIQHHSGKCILSAKVSLNIYSSILRLTDTDDSSH